MTNISQLTTSPLTLYQNESKLNLNSTQANEGGLGLHDHFLTSHAAYIASLSEATSYISAINSDFNDIIKNNNSYYFRIAEFWASISIISAYETTFTFESIAS